MNAKYVDGKAPPAVAERPKCPFCSKPLRPLVHTPWIRLTHPAGGFTTVPGSGSWDGQYHAYGAFCTLRCCQAFANAAYRAGYRIVS